MKLEESIYGISEEALQDIEERLFDLELFLYAIEKNESGLFLKSYDPKIDALLKRMGYEPLEKKQVDPLEWTKRQLREPFEIAKKVIVDPVGIYKGSGEIILRIPPGMAFGTGIHPTTRLAASFIVDYFKPRMSFLDVGAGSGILSILAAKLGASKIVGVDIDRLSVEVARENARLNGVSIDFRMGDLVNEIDEKFDFVVANIVPKVLIKLSKGVLKVVHRETFLLLSGINVEEFQRVLRAYRSRGFESLEVRREEGWKATILKLSKSNWEEI